MQQEFPNWHLVDERAFEQGVLALHWKYSDYGFSGALMATGYSYVSKPAGEVTRIWSNGSSEVI